MSIERLGTTARYSDAVIHQNVVYTVEVPATDAVDVATQTREVLAGLERQLAAAGSSPAHVLMATVYLTDMADYAAMNAVWDAWVPAGTAPARACVQVSALAMPGWRVEIALTAARA